MHSVNLTCEIPKSITECFRIFNNQKGQVQFGQRYEEEDVFKKQSNKVRHSHQSSTASKLLDRNASKKKSLLKALTLENNITNVVLH